MVDNDNMSDQKEFKWYKTLEDTLLVITCFLAFLSFEIQIIFLIPYCAASFLGLIASFIIGRLIEKKINILQIILSILGIVIATAFWVYLFTYSKAQVDAKPIIYLYPQKTTEVNVLLGNPKYLTCSYPKYNEEKGWNVIVEPNGNMKYISEDNKEQNLYSLYWEGEPALNKKIKSDGFIVSGEDTIEFLQEKLNQLGLTEREAEEFIVYWLPQMEDNKYNYIRFETLKEIEENMPLNISPKPDTTIRIMMDWCAIKGEFEAKVLKSKIKEQEINIPERKGFVVVEWGGCKIRK